MNARPVLVSVAGDELDDDHFRVRGVVDGGRLQVVEMNRARRAAAGELADRLPPVQPAGQIRPGERQLDHAVGREQRDEAFGVLVQQQLPALLQDLIGAAIIGASFPCC